MIERLLRMAKKAGCTDAEVFVQESVSDVAASERGVLNETVSSNGAGVGLRVNFKGRTGFSFCAPPPRPGGNFHPGSLVKSAVSSAKVGDKFTGFPKKQKYGRVSGQFDRKIAETGTGEIIDMTLGMLSVLKTFRKVRPTYAGVSRTLYRHTVANTNGVFVTERASGIGCGAYVTIGPVVGWKSCESRALDGIDPGATARAAAGRAIEALNPKKIAGKEMDVILRPECLGSEDGLLGGTILEAVSGENVFRKASKLAGKLGTEVFSGNVNAFDDGLIPDGLNSWAADTEGTASRRTTIIEKGILKGFLYDSTSAARAGAGSTANGYRGFSSIPSVHPSNFVLQAGKSDEGDLVRDMKEGLLVNWLSGTHTANGFSGDFSVEAKNAFYVKNGKIVHPVKSVMLSGNVFSMMEDCECASNLEQMPGGISAPSIKTRLNVVA